MNNIDDNQSRVEVSLILPCFNSARFLEASVTEAVGFLEKNGWVWELLLVDDGSNDDGATWNILSEAQAQNVRIRAFRFPNNQGKGRAIRKGLQESRGRYCVFTDADLPYRFEDVEAVLHFLQEGRHDLVVGDRCLPGASYHDVISPSRRFLSRFFAILVETICLPGYFDTQCGLKGFAGPVARMLAPLLRTRGFACDIEMVYIALRNGLSVKRIPVVLRQNEKGTLSVFKAVRNMFVDVLRISWRKIRDQYRHPELVQWALHDYRDISKPGASDKGKP